MVPSSQKFRNKLVFMHYALIEKCLKSDKLIKDGTSPNLGLRFIPASQKKKFFLGDTVGKQSLCLYFSKVWSILNVYNWNMKG